MIFHEYVDGGWDVGPDALDLVTEVADMMSVFAAQRFERIDSMRREALDDAERHGGAVAHVVERSVRLELAAGMRITEHAAAGLIAQAEVWSTGIPRPSSHSRARG